MESKDNDAWLDALAKIYADAAKNRALKRLGKTAGGKETEPSTEDKPQRPRDKTRKK